MIHFILRLFVIFGLVVPSARALVIINEIMYHPSSENPAEEWIELYNDGASAVSLTGWKFTSGVTYTFPSSSIPAGGYLVVAANAAAFTAKYPGVSNYVAGWTGKLSNSANKITLTNNVSVVQDEVKYSDDGDWADRYQDNPPDLGHRGWYWKSDADGYGKSLELIQPAFDNSLGQNWKASVTAQGTPGVVNSSLSTNVAPFITNVQHFPMIPKSTDAVIFTAKIQEDVSGAITATLFYREDGGSWASTAMNDAGTSPDVAAGDKTYSVQIAGNTYANGKIVEFYVQATDNGARTRQWPKLAYDFNNSQVQVCNAMYQVDNTSYSGAAPIYRIIMKAADRASLATINDGNTQSDNYSDARFNSTFITIDGTSSELRYLCSTKNRGHGSASAQPASLNISIPNDWDWNGKTSFDLNTQHTYLQLFGSAIFRKSGLAAPESRQIQLRVNGTDPTTLVGGSNLGSSNNFGNSFGFYVCNESKDSEFISSRYPQDGDGNLYAVRREDNAPNREGTLAYMPPAMGESAEDPYRAVFFKQTNKSEDNWTDIITATTAISKGQSSSMTAMTWTPDYLSSIYASIDVEQFMRWFAVESLLVNVESNITTGIGDDYYIYFGANDPRAKLIPHDLDTILGDGVVFAWPAYYTESPLVDIFAMTKKGYVDNVPSALNSFMKHPEFTPIYYRELLDLMNGELSVANFNVMADQLLPGLVIQSVIDARKTWYALRVAYVRLQIPLQIQDIVSTGTVTNGYRRVTSPTCLLTGRANAIDTRSVKVNGVAAQWTAWSATWLHPTVTLTPGINRILIQAFDGASNEIDRTTFDVWYDDSTTTNVSGNIATSTWTAAAGPYNVTGSITVPNGSTLTIEPGTTVYFASTATLTVQAGGRLLAVGTETQPIRFTSAPATAPIWNGIIINGTTPLPAASHISYAFFERNGTSTSGTVAIKTQNNANVIFDHLEFGATGAPYINMDSTSFLIHDCIFPTTTASFEPLHGTNGVPTGGRGIFRNCFFGKANGYNDVIDFSGGNRPSPIVQYINNVFAGSDDDILDLDASDSWIEGNLFMNCHRVNSPDSASAVSGGAEGGITSEVTMVGNIFYNNDHAAMAKHSNFYTMLNNTIVKQTRVGGQEPVPAGVISLGETDAGVLRAMGMYLEGNIISDAEAITVNYSPGISTVTLNNNLLPVSWAGPGSGNTVNDPFFNDISNVPTPTERNYRYLLPKIREMFSLKSYSPAKGTGPNGQDKGAIRSAGVSISGAPVGTTNQTSATLTVGKLMTGSGIPSAADKFPSGSGWTHYKYRLDGGGWSAETPIANQITLAGLGNGAHYVEAVGRNDAAFYQDHADYGASAAITKTATWTVNTGYTPPAAQAVVQINELLANNTETVAFGTVFPDVIELKNAGTVAADLSGWGVTDNSSIPYKYMIPNGTTLEAGAHLVIYASGNGSVPQPKTGFGIKSSGDTVTLTKSVAAGGGVADSIAYGNQIPDYSIGRAPDGTWTLCTPTLGAANLMKGLGYTNGVRINEWLTDPGVLESDDFIELYNPSNNPVNIGNCHLTDNPSGWPDRHQIRQLTFIPAGGYIVFEADENTTSGPDHLSFKLSALQGEIGLMDAALNFIDSVVYGPQRTDVSEGRSPNGSSTMAFFNQPTAGAPNPAPTGTQAVNLISVNQVWKYYSNISAPPNDAQGRTFSATLFDDALWSSGVGLLYVEPDTLTQNTEGFVKNTPLPQRSGGGPLQTNYFRTHFNYSGPLSGTTLTAKIIVDDGCVVYLNGTEITPTTGSRIRVAAGTVSYSTVSTGAATDGLVETYTFNANQLLVGNNVIAVSVHQNGTSSDIVFGMKLDASIFSPVLINEVFVLNNSIQNPDLSYSSWIELYNPSGTAVNLSDYSLSDSIGNPRKYVFGNVSVPATGYLVVQCNPLLAASSTNTGFGLTGEGDQVYLFSPLATNGTLLNNISFGQQLGDYSVGRIPNGGANWVLTTPSRTGFNTAALMGNVSDIRINEWNSYPTAEDSWFEIFHSATANTRPILLSSNYLTDNLADRKKYLIPPLSYIGGSGTARWQKWVADNDGGGSYGHVNFSLNPAGESIGLFTAAGAQINAITYAAQSPNQSGGRLSDGAVTIFTSIPPTPGTTNIQFALDSDGDGMPNSWETANGFNPNNAADASLDTDEDGQTNLQEYLAGTNPRLPGSRLGASVSPTPGGGQFAISFTALAGKTYTVRYKNALSDANWQNVGQLSAPASDTPTIVYDTPAPGTGKRFYQVVTPGVP